MSVSKERQLNCYPHPVYLMKLLAYAKLNEMSKAGAASHAIKCFIDNLPPDQKIRVINAAKEIKLRSKNTY